MLKVILIDDEEAILKGLKVLIDWKGIGFDIVGEAYDGEEGLELIKKLRPDIIITDVRMPVVNGLELLDKARNVVPEAKTIILSGYSDFEYARKAIENGAFSYLLKPVTREEITEKLCKAAKEIEKERIKQHQDEKISTRLHNLQPAAREKILKDIIEGVTASEAEIERAWRLLEFGTMPECFCVVVFELDSFETPGFDMEKDRRILKFAVDNIIEELVQKSGLGIAFNYNEEKTVIICYPMELAASFSACRHNMKPVIDLVNEIKDTVAEYLKITLSAGIGAWHTSTAQMKVSFSEACSALKRKIIYGKNCILHTGEPSFKMEDMVFQPIHFERELRINVENCDRERAIEALGKLFHYMTLQLRNAPELIYGECISILVQLRQIAYEYELDAKILFSEEFFANEYFRRFKTYTDLESWIGRIITALTGQIAARPSHPTEQMVEKIKKHVDKCYASVSRESVANDFYINPSYLSQIFKQYAGINFSDYLTQVRMEKAKQLLLNSDMKVTDIAEKVGYGSSQHFSRVFEKANGATPIEFKRNLLQTLKGRK